MLALCGLCCHIRAPTSLSCPSTRVPPPAALLDDDPADARFAELWEEAKDAPGTPVWSARSSLDPHTAVAVCEHAGSWRSLSFVSPASHNVQSVSMVGEPRAVTLEYLKTMAALALAGSASGSARGSSAAPRLLFLGLGAGTLPALLAHHLPAASTLHAVEYDATVAAAAATELGLPRSVSVDVDDAAAWLRRRAASLEQQEADGPGGYEMIFVDIFDRDNMAPRVFYSDAFLADARRCLDSSGVLVHNLHYGTDELDASFDQAAAAYASSEFADLCLVPAQRHGNVIIGAAASERTFSDSDALQAAARSERRRLGLLFDAAGRLAPLRAVPRDRSTRGLARRLDVAWG